MRIWFLLAVLAVFIFGSFLTAQTVTTFSFTGSVQTFTVPSCITQLSVDIRGARGGTGYSVISQGGNGGRVQAVISVTPGNVLEIRVGGEGSSASYSVPGVGGYNGGANGAAGGPWGGGGGGGASDIRLSPYNVSNRILVAGGGGGGAYNYNTTNYERGGMGGGTTGEAGYYGNSVSSGAGGAGGSQVGGGAGGYYSGYCTGSTGSIAIGGAGGACWNSGGGGGGGYYGGGGGVWAGGGGGSSYVISTGSNVTHTQGAQAGNGIVTFSYALNSAAVVVSSVSQTICTGASATLTASNVSTYTWNTGSNSSAIIVSPSATTIYSVSGTNTLGCVTSAQINLKVDQQLPQLSVVNTASTGVCPGKSATLTASGADTYTWAGIQSVTNGVGFLLTQSSGYTVTGANSCGTNTAATTVSVHPLPVVGVAMSQASICSGQTFTLTGVGNANSYSWSHGVQNGQSNVATVSTNYTVTGTSALSCTNSATASLQVITTPVITPVLSTVSICKGGQATITVSGATNYTWLPMNANGSSIIVNPTAPATYTVVGGTSNCVDSKTVFLQVNQPPLVFAVTSEATVCASKPAILTAGGGITYTWYPTGGFQYTAVVAPSVTTIYTVVVSSGSCVASQTVEVNTYPNPTINVVASQSVICRGESVNISLSGAGNYTWSAPGMTGNSGILTPSVSTLYTFSGINNFSCTSSASQVVLVNLLPVVNAARSRTLVCSGFPSTLTASGAQSYTWSNGSSAPVTTVFPVTTTVYTVTGSYTTTGCKNSSTVQVAVFQPTFTTNSNTFICLGDSVLLSASPVNNYSWMGPGGQLTVSPQVYVHPGVASIYTVSGLFPSPFGYVTCSASKSVSVGVNNKPVITAVAEQTLICTGDKIKLFGVGGINYSWSIGATDSIVMISPFVTTVYTLTGKDANNCVNTSTVMVRVSACPGFKENQPGLSGLTLYPNPNNGTFMIKADMAVQLVLRNQLGQVIETFTLDNENNFQANINHLSDGIYFVCGRYNGQVISQKILVTK